MTSPWYQESAAQPVDHVPIEPPTPKRMSRMATAALFVLTFLVGMFAGLAL